MDSMTELASAILGIYRREFLGKDGQAVRRTKMCMHAVESRSDQDALEATLEALGIS